MASTLECILIDDDSTHNFSLQCMLENVRVSLDIPLAVGLCTTSGKKLLDYASKPSPNQRVYFLDIDLADDENGIELCSKLHDLDPLGYIIYVSAYQQFALQCCRSHAFDFLLKPFTERELLQTMQAVVRDLNHHREGKKLSVHLGDQMLLIPESDILYFKSDRIYLQAYTVGNTYTWRCSFTALFQQMDESHFLMPHRSYRVALAHIVSADWSEQKLLLSDGSRVPIARRCIDNVRKALNATV